MDVKSENTMFENDFTAQKLPNNVALNVI